MVTMLASLGINIQTACCQKKLSSTPEGRAQLQSRKAATAILSSVACVMNAVVVCLGGTSPEKNGGNVGVSN